MSISLDTAKKLNWLWKDENKIAWIETFIKITDKETHTVPFILTDEQRNLVENLAHKNIISKSRQCGISSITLALSIRQSVIYPNTTCVLISHTQTSTNAVFEKLKQQFYSLPDWLRPNLLTNNRQALTFENGSSIVCMTCGNRPIGRGSTYNGIVHLSEFAFYKNQQEQLTSIMQAVTSSATVIIESTSNGYNEYSSLFLGAKNGENDWKPFFFNFINGRALFKPQYDEAVRLYKARHNGKMLTEGDYDEEELQLAKLGMTPEQAVWRRGKIAESSLESFHVEYPATPEQSFVATGSAVVYDNAKVVKLQQALVDQKVKPLSVDKIVGLPQILRTYVQNKSLDIYKVPRVGMKYYIGVDVSEGLGGKHDYSTMFVMDKDGEQVAEFHNNKVQPYLYADICNAVGRFYNKALLCVEKASGGHSVIERLRYEHKYMNMVKYKTYDEYNRAVWKVGFDTTQKSKSIAVNDAREWFDKGMVRIMSNNLLEEMKTFVAEENGSFNAVVGCHDDLVSAFWLCIQGMKSGFWYPF